MQEAEQHGARILVSQQRRHVAAKQQSRQPGDVAGDLPESSPADVGHVRPGLVCTAGRQEELG